MVVRVKPLRTSVTMLTGLPMLLCVPVRGIANLLMGWHGRCSCPAQLVLHYEVELARHAHHSGTEDTEARVPFSLLGTLCVSVVKATLVVIFRWAQRSRAVTYRAGRRSGGLFMHSSL